MRSGDMVNAQREKRLALFVILALFALMIIALAVMATGCTLLTDKAPPSLALPALQAGEAGLETAALIAEDGAATARRAAETAETPIGVISGWLLSLALAGAAGFLKKRLEDCRKAIKIVTGKIEARDAAEVKVSVARAMQGETEGVRQALTLALD